MCVCVRIVSARVYVFSSTDCSVEAKFRGRSHCCHSFIYPHMFILYGYIHQILGSHTGVVGQGQRGEERVCRQLGTGGVGQTQRERMQTELGTGGVDQTHRERVQTELGTGQVGQTQRERVQTELGMGEVGQTERRGCADRTGYG